jgi:hypothetical protein
MIVVTRQSREGVETQFGISLNNVIECNPQEDGGSWVKYWDATRVVSVRCTQSVEQVANLMHFARLGKLT